MKITSQDIWTERKDKEVATVMKQLLHNKQEHPIISH